MKKMVLAAVAAAMFASCHVQIDSDEQIGGGVINRENFVVNGVKWAQCNVAMPGKFAAHPADYGGYFNFEAAQNACPDGWRTPTQAEWAQLFSLPSHDETYRGIKGRLFGIGEHNTRVEMRMPLLFLPMAGNYLGGELVGTGDRGYYWTSTTSQRYADSPNAYAAEINAYDRPEVEDGLLYTNGFSVRCVEKKYYQ